VRDGARVTCDGARVRDGARVTCGGARVTCGGARVTCGGARVTCGGRSSPSSSSCSSAATAAASSSSSRHLRLLHLLLSPGDSALGADAKKKMAYQSSWDKKRHQDNPGARTVTDRYRTLTPAVPTPEQTARATAADR